MKTTSNKYFFKNLFSAAVVMALFVLVSYYTQRNSEVIRELIQSGGLLSILAYIFAAVIAIVAAPLTSIPLIPLVVESWGVFWTSIFSIVGWFVGSMAAFWIARKLGAPLVSRFESLEKARSIASSVPKKKIFWYLIFLRLTIPVDLLSYALGLFTKVSWRIFALTTIIGIIPMTFAFSYLGTLPVQLQIPLFVLGLILIVFFVFFHFRRK